MLTIFSAAERFIHDIYLPICVCSLCRRIMLTMMFRWHRRTEFGLPVVLRYCCQRLRRQWERYHLPTSHGPWIIMSKCGKMRAVWDSLPCNNASRINIPKHLRYVNMWWEPTDPRLSRLPVYPFPPPFQPTMTTKAPSLYLVSPPSIPWTFELTAPGYIRIVTLRQSIHYL